MRKLNYYLINLLFAMYRNRSDSESSGRISRRRAMQAIVGTGVLGTGVMSIGTGSAGTNSPEPPEDVLDYDQNSVTASQYWSTPYESGYNIVDLEAYAWLMPSYQIEDQLYLHVITNSQAYFNVEREYTGYGYSFIRDSADAYFAYPSATFRTPPTLNHEVSVTNGIVENDNPERDYSAGFKEESDLSFDTIPLETVRWTLAEASDKYNLIETGVGLYDAVKSDWATHQDNTDSTDDSTATISFSGAVQTNADDNNGILTGDSVIEIKRAPSASAGVDIDATTPSVTGQSGVDTDKWTLPSASVPLSVNE